ncbi:hypothetical protein BV25DRAFT_1921001 [Artomyces pyxidatus]|uniref:Uncharacterized protein n=1 Tax=Artomyces pyxidatus TaxID=48021 RepID=A0ACB8SJ97_9AGAM|nr:hypothetical protein BV25DRAFT_1921001 [Artomyces pyxidatus]
MDPLQEIKAFPYDFDEKSMDSVQQHENTMMGLRRQALNRPLRSGATFDIHLNRHDAADQPPRARPLPSFAHATASHTLVLETLLQPGLERWSEVWIARVVSPTSGASDPSQPSDRVVLKFIQPSMLKFPSVEQAKRTNEWKESYYPPKYLASREDGMYHVLQLAQGFAVPYYFGVHQVTMPNGEHAHMLVMEYIPGVCLSAWKMSRAHSTNDRQSTLDPTTHAALVPFLRNTTVMAFRSLKAIQDLGVLHADVNARNMILYPSDSAPSQVVFIDLFTAANKNIWPRWFRVEKFHCLEAFRCCIQHSHTVTAWLEENLPEELRPLILTRSGDLV